MRTRRYSTLVGCNHKWPLSLGKIPCSLKLQLLQFIELCSLMLFHLEALDLQLVRFVSQPCSSPLTLVEIQQSWVVPSPEIAWRFSGEGAGPRRIESRLQSGLTRGYRDQGRRIDDGISTRSCYRVGDGGGGKGHERLLLRQKGAR